MSDLLKHLPIEILNNCISYLKIKNINKESNIISIPIKINDKYGYENVSEITGTAIPAYFQYKKNNKMTILDEISNDPNYDLNNINIENIKGNELLYISNLYCSFRSGFKFKTYQISNYDWLSYDNLNLAIDRLNKLNISNNAKFEIGYEAENEKLEPRPELRDRRLIGFIDCIDDNNIYEFKCVKKLEKEHILQLAIYMYLHELEIRKNEKIKINVLNVGELKKLLEKYKNELNENNIKISKLKMRKKINELINIKINQLIKEIETYKNIISNNYYLYNILSDEMIQIKCEFNELKQMIEYLIYSKYKDNKLISDDKFILKFKDIFNKYSVNF